MQASGHLVATAAELPASMEHRQDDSQGRNLLDRMLVDRDTPAVVGHPHPAVVEKSDIDPVAVAGQSLVDGVVDDFPDEVVQAALAGGPDVHTGSLAHSLEALEHSDRGGVVDRYCRVVHSRHRDKGRLDIVGRLGIGSLPSRVGRLSAVFFVEGHSANLQISSVAAGGNLTSGSARVERSSSGLDPVSKKGRPPDVCRRVATVLGSPRLGDLTAVSFTSQYRRPGPVAGT